MPWEFGRVGRAAERARLQLVYAIRAARCGWYPFALLTDPSTVWIRPRHLENTRVRASFLCCGAKVERSGETITLVIYRCRDCIGCPLAERCRKTVDAKRGRKVTRDGYESVRFRHGERMRQEDAIARYKRRLHFGETPFAVLKAALDLRRFLLRGLEGVQQEWLWGCTAFNLKKLMSLWEGVRAKLSEMTAAAVD